MDPYAGVIPEAAHEWEDYKFCGCVGEDTEHLFIEWRDEPVVTWECLACKNTGFIEDIEP